MGSDALRLWELSGGSCPIGWDIVTLETLLESPKSISVGVMYPGSHAEDGTPLVKVSDVKKGQISKQPDFKVSLAVDNEYKRTRLVGDEFLITLVGNPGDCVVVDSSMVGWNVARALAVLKLKDPDLRQWLKLILLSPASKHIIDSRLNTTVQKTLNLKDIKELPVPIPPFQIRENISYISKFFERKLNLNQQTNQTLEQMAQALFKSWFVDFDPVIDNMLAAGNLNTNHTIPDALQHRVEIRKKAHALQKQNPNIKPLDKATQSLFPNEFEPCGDKNLGIQGWIPKGWEITSFESLISLIGGGTPKTTNEEYWNGEIPWFSVVDAPNDSDVFVIDTEKHVTQLGVEKSSTKILRTGTTIISARGTVGKCALVSAPMAMNQSCYGIVGKFENHDEYIYFLTRYQVSDLQKRGHGSVFNTITRETFKSILVTKSGDLLTRKFSETVYPYLSKILLNNKQNRELTKLRDTLLPKLISGELDIRHLTDKTS